MVRKIIIKYPKARLESCGDKGKYNKYSHLNGCYLRLSDKEINHTTDYDGMILLDFDKNNYLVSIEFVDGIEYKPNDKTNTRRNKKKAERKKSQD